jgi:hypothetical protein
MDEPMSGLAGDAETMRLVDQQHGIVAGTGVGEVGQRRGVAQDGEDRLGQHERAWLGTSAQSLVDRRDVAVRRHDDACSGEPAGVDERCMDVRVGDHERAGVG